jgi:hypothetical protein
MPANLNALIRYKTINSCLYGGRRKWSIRELIEACSEALGESRGRYILISERTIRDDLRILKSDILGFNAPIEQEKGLYFYSDPQFSILTLKITDAGLADKIHAFLITLRKEIQHPELESILELLCKLTNKTYEKPVLTRDIKTEEKHDTMFDISPLEEYISEMSYMADVEPSPGKSLSLRFKDIKASLSIKKKTSHVCPDIPFKEKTALSWGDVLKIVAND